MIKLIFDNLLTIRVTVWKAIFTENNKTINKFVSRVNMLQLWKKCPEKHVLVRILRNGLAESIREGPESATPLGAQLKKNTKTFLRSLSVSTSFW